ncbi:MAG: SMP-30/gluconolactonase/LRE family protein [Paracoccaceae bacterium]
MIDFATLEWIGEGLQRPECALAHGSGLIFAPSWERNGGVSVISPGGATRTIGAKGATVRPNGIALEAGGTFLLADLGDEFGALNRMDHEGRVEPVLTELDGRRLPPANFVLLDGEGRIWLTVSTTVRPRADDYRKGANTGFIVLIDGAGARIVADGLGYANECALSADGETLFVNETFARRTSAYRLGANGALSGRRVVAEYGAGTYPDGMALDVEGALWITSIVSNRVIRVMPGGEQRVMLEDMDSAHVDWAEEAWESDRLGRPHLDQAKSSALRNISNLAFAGEGLGQAVLGCLLGDRLARFDSPAPGLAPAHWRADLGPLARFLD